MKELCVKGSYALSLDRFLQHRRPNIHAKPACTSKKRLTNQEFMPSDYYTSYIPFITATPKEDFIPVGNTNRQQVGGRKLLPASRIVLYIAETMKNRTIPFVLVWFCVSSSSFFLMALKNIRILCLGFLCVSLKSLFLKATKNKGVLSYGLLCFMLFNLSDAWAQSAETRTAEGQIQPSTVRLGEKVPDSFFEIIHKAYHIRNKRDTTVSFSAFADKLIIIDFYAYWCGPCIYSVNKFSELLEEYPDDDYLFMPVTRHSVQESKMLFDKYKWNLTTIIQDDILKQYFPYQSIPHQVWIRNGEVIAMPVHTYATRENIHKAINGDPFKVFDKIQDQKIDPSKPFEIQLKGHPPLIANGDSRWYGMLEGFQYARPTINTRNDSTFYYFVNIPLEQVLIEAYRDTLFPPESQLPEGGIDWKTEEGLSKRFLIKPDTSGLTIYAKDSLRYEWQKGRKFSYFSAVDSEIVASNQRITLRENLNRLLSEKFGITVSIVPSKPKSFVRLYRLGSKEDTKQKLTAGLSTGRDWQGEKDGIVSQKNVPFSQHFLGRLAESLRAIPDHDFSYDNMVLDETGIEGELICYFEFPKAMWGDFQAIERELARYDLGIRWTREQVSTILVKGSDYKTNGVTQ